MRKSTLFISAALTTFMLAIMFGVASAYQKIVQASIPTQTTVPTEVVQVQPTDVIAPTVAVAAPTDNTITVEQAATLASNVLGHTDLYSGEISQFEGSDAYLITFSSGDLVYVSLTGQILSISKLPATVILAPATGGGHHGNGGGTSVTNPPPSTGGGNGNGGGGDDGGNENGHEGGDD